MGHLARINYRGGGSAADRRKTKRTTKCNTWPVWVGGRGETLKAVAAVNNRSAFEEKSNNNKFTTGGRERVEGKVGWVAVLGC